MLWNSSIIYILLRFRIFGTGDSLSLSRLDCLLCGLSGSAIPFRCSSFMHRQYSTPLSLLHLLLLLFLSSTLLSCFRSRFGVWQGSRVIDPGNDLHLLPAKQFPHYTLHSPLIHLLLHLSLSLSLSTISSDKFRVWRIFLFVCRLHCCCCCCCSCCLRFSFAPVCCCLCPPPFGQS